MILKSIRPMYNSILVTANKQPEKKNGLYVAQTNSLLEYQTVVAVGNMVREIKVGDVVMVNPSKYEVTKYHKNSVKDNIEEMNQVKRYNFKMVKLDGVEHLMIFESDIEYVITGMDETKDEEFNTEEGSEVLEVINKFNKNLKKDKSGNTLILPKEGPELILPSTDIIV